MVFGFLRHVEFLKKNVILKENYTIFNKLKKIKSQFFLIFSLIEHF